MPLTNWIFITKSTSEELNRQVVNKKWPIYQYTPNKKKLQVGDNIIFYKAGQDGQKFIGKARINTKLANNGSTDYSIGISNIEIWEKPIAIKDIISELQFIVDKINWGIHFQSGVRRISDNDYRTIISKIF